MAENINALILPIGADVSTFEKSIKEVKDALKSLKTQIEGTSFNLVKPEQIQQLKSLENTLESLQAKVSQTNFNQFTNSSKQARTALNSLSLVAQDAPFGFIGIQNNLPGVIQSFGQLTTQAGGLKGGLSALGKSLVGPAGLFLAFSAVTAAVTFAVQKYGSFGAAVDALFGKIDPLKNTIDRITKSYNEYNKEIKSNAEISALASTSQAGLIETVSILTKKATDLSTSEQQRGKYLNELKNIDKDYFGQLTTGVGDVDKIREATDKYTDSLIANSTVKAYQSQLDAIEAQIAPLTVLREDLKTNLVLAQKLDKYNKSIISQSAKLGGGGAATGLGDPIAAATKSLDENAASLESLYKTRDKFIAGLTESIDSLQNIVKPKKEPKVPKGDKIKLDALEIETQDLDAAFNLDKIISNITKYSNVLLDLNNKEADRKKALQELIAINPQVFSGLTLEKNGLLANKQTIENYNRSLQVLIQSKKDDARASEINAQFRNAELKSQDEQAKSQYNRIKAYEDTFDSIVKLTYGQDQYGNSTDKQIVKAFEFTKALKQQQDIFAAINKGLNNIYGAGTAEENDPVKRIDDLAKRIKQAKDNFQNTIRNGLQEPFDDFFTSLIETGKFSLDSFEGLFKDMLKRIAAQIVSAGIAKLISSILFPPGAAASALAGAAAGNSSSGGIIGALVSLFGGRSAMNNVNFGGVESGGMQLAGAVNLQLRGSDLVGSINRTNTTINRVG